MSLTSRLQAVCDRRLDRQTVGLRFMLGVLALSRLALLLWRIPALAGTAIAHDLRHILAAARLSDQGLYPYLGFWMEYPPVYPWLAVGVYRAGRWLVAEGAIETWFYAAFGVLLVLCEAGTFLLLHAIALQLHGVQSARRSALIYLLLTVPGYVVAGWFDPLPTLLFMAALYLLLKSRTRWSGLMIGLGIVAKVFPAVLLPLAFAIARGWRNKLICVLVVAAVVGLCWLPFLLASPEMTLASLRNQLGRSSWETIWALMDGYYGYGMVAPLAERLDAGQALAANHPSDLPWTQITLFFALAYAIFYRGAWRIRQPQEIVAAAAFSLHLLLLYSKGYSPQYLLWIAPLLAILFPNRRGALYLGWLSLINLIELPGYFSFFPEFRALLIFPVVARTALHALIAAECLRLSVAPAFWRMTASRTTAPAAAE